MHTMHRVPLYSSPSPPRSPSCLFHVCLFICCCFLSNFCFVLFLFCCTCDNRCFFRLSFLCRACTFTMCFHPRHNLGSSFSVVYVFKMSYPLSANASSLESHLLFPIMAISALYPFRISIGRADFLFRQPLLMHACLLR